MDTLLIEQDSIPDGGRFGVLDPESAKVELPLANQLVAGFSRWSNMSASHTQVGFPSVRAKWARVQISGRIE